MSQSQERSLLETCCNVGTGIFTAYLTGVWIVMPWAGIVAVDLNKLTVLGVIAINISFTIVSVVRGFVWRRVFNKGDS